MAGEKEIIEELFERGVLVNKDLLSRELQPTLLREIEVEEDIIVLNSDYAEVIRQQSNLVDWYELDQYRVEAEKERNEELYQSHLQQFRKSTLVLHPNPDLPDVFPPHRLSPAAASFSPSSSMQELSTLELELNRPASFAAEVPKSPETLLDVSFSPGALLPDTSGIGILTSTENTVVCPRNVTVILTPRRSPQKYELPDFTTIFTSRYKFLEGLLRNRVQLQNIVSINRLQGKRERENVSVIGMVNEIETTKNGNIIVTLEDLTGSIKLLFSKNKQELFASARDLVHDEIIGVSGVSGDKIIFADAILWPDLPSAPELKKPGPEHPEEFAIFLSDIHVGSAVFLHEEFQKFLQWINGNLGDENQRTIASKVKYIFLVGDLVDGVGVYPSQEDELAIKDIKQQYAALAELLRQIPADKQLIMCPGNHDVVHLAEPQPLFYPEFAAPLYSLPNALLVTNPAMVNISKTQNFAGFDVLMYHGYSFDYYVSNVESIRTGGGYQRADLIMKFLLKRRHLAPSFKSTPYFPGYPQDPLLITKIPDFFVTGHIHYSSIANYKGVTMISCSCWQGKTSFQEKLGHKPEPARLPIVNLKTREVKVLRF